MIYCSKYLQLTVHVAYYTVRSLISGVCVIPLIWSSEEVAVDNNDFFLNKLQCILYSKLYGVYGMQCRPSSERLTVENI